MMVPSSKLILVGYSMVEKPLISSRALKRTTFLYTDDISRNIKRYLEAGNGVGPRWDRKTPRDSHVFE